MTLLTLLSIVVLITYRRKLLWVATQIGRDISESLGFSEPDDADTSTQ